MDKLYPRRSHDSSTGEEHEELHKIDAFHAGDLETCARHRVPYGSPPSDADLIHPLKREVVINKEPAQDFGTSLCLLHGDVFVTDVREDSPAWRVGLCPGDRVEAIDDVHIRPDEFHRRHVQPQKILQYMRNRPKLEIKVCDQPTTRIHTVPPVHFAGDDLGLEYHNGVISTVRGESTAEKCGIRTGESIFQVDDDLMVGKNDDDVLVLIEERRRTGPVQVSTIPAELALEMVWAQLMINSRDEAHTNKEKRRRDSWLRRSLCSPHPHQTLIG